MKRGKNRSHEEISAPLGLENLQFSGAFLLFEFSHSVTLGRFKIYHELDLRVNFIHSLGSQRSNGYILHNVLKKVKRSSRKFCSAIYSYCDFWNCFPANTHMRKFWKYSWKYSNESRIVLQNFIIFLYTNLKIKIPESPKDQICQKPKNNINSSPFTSFLYFVSEALINRKHDKLAIVKHKMHTRD